ncbi:HNH endonuclease signature motif containing protein [Glycomyces buryatensis]|uniref:HNH nuclease domain-containing protein n=1 Tax=Glycomyces buryatensis TaxID=2570927 RepID=A0A4S8QFW7_9ACTN|nr:HNH endonuclease signature motif containing protein [Glycomyces buryatensis]THV43318.1 hypothetical protein FAB82_01165 [Glycomyces buryatensis]
MAASTERALGPGLPETTAAALHGRIDALASQSRAIEAEVLRDVIAYTSSGTHRSRDGFSGIRDWIIECFDFHRSVAGAIASIARLAPKFKVLTKAAREGTARIDAVAYAARRLEREGLTRHARTLYPAGPIESPFDASVPCATPEELVREYCTHAPFADLVQHLDRLCADLLDDQSLKDEASQQTLAWVEATQRPDRMWDLQGRLTEATGALLDNLFKTAVPPPSQDQADADGLLPAAANRNAEALHQVLASYGTDPAAPRRHGHTATLSLVADVEVLRGEVDLAASPERTPTLDGRAVSVSRARLLACEAGVIPVVFDYEKGEAVELGREERLPNTALRRKLETEQPDGCAWHGCTRPVSWCESHHVDHWIDGGKTDADNLILLCRFHHGRIHTRQWKVEKTGPGQARITHTPTGNTDADWETDYTSGAAASGLPTGLDASEYAPAFEHELNAIATETEWRTAVDAALAARTQARQRFTDTETPTATTSPPGPAKAPALSGTRAGTAGPLPGTEDLGPPPFLPSPGTPAGDRERTPPTRSSPRGTGHHHAQATPEPPRPQSHRRPHPHPGIRIRTTHCGRDRNRNRDQRSSGLPRTPPAPASDPRQSPHPSIADRLKPNRTPAPPRQRTPEMDPPLHR